MSGHINTHTLLARLAHAFCHPLLASATPVFSLSG